MQTTQHDSSVMALQQTRGDDSAASFIPLLTSDMILLEAGCGPGECRSAKKLI